MTPTPTSLNTPNQLPYQWARGMSLTRVVVASAAVLLIAAGGVWAITRDGGSSAGMRAVANLELGTVEMGSFAINTTSMGELEARNQIELRSELDARADIVQIVDEGAVVKKGDLLVQLNAEQLQDEIDQQNLEVERGQAEVTAAENALKIQLSENESRERAGQLKIDIAELALAQWREGEVVKTRAKQKLDIEQAVRDLDRLKETYELSMSLHAEGFLSKNQLQQDEMDLIRAEATLQTAKLDQGTYEEFQYPRDEKTKISDLEEARADLDRIKTQNEINAGAKASSLGTTSRQFEFKEERLAKLTEQVGLATILAPTDGLVVYATSLGRGRDMMIIGGDGALQVGREVRPNEKLIVLPDTSSMVASVRVHESLAGRVRAGQRATITIDAIIGQSFAGTVESVGVLAESGGWRDPNRREYTVRIAIDHDNSDGRLKPSMRAEAEIMLAAVQDSMIVPVQAVFNEGPVKYVLVPRGSRFERVPVRTGRMSDTYAEIISGVDVNDSVLLREPDTGELVPGEWTTAQLEAVGVALDEDGKPMTARRGAEMMRMMGGAGSTGSGGTSRTMRQGQGSEGQSNTRNRGGGGQRPQSGQQSERGDNNQQTKDATTTQSPAADARTGDSDSAHAEGTPASTAPAGKAERQAAEDSQD